MSAKIPSKSPSKKPYHHGNLKAALLEAALLLIHEKGVEQFTLREVARRAGVSPAAPYRHFDDKNALLATVALEGLRMLSAAIAEVEATACTHDPMEAFRAGGIAYIRFAIEYPAHFRVMNLPSLRNSQYEQLQQEIKNRQQLMVEAIQAGQEMGLLYEANPKHIALTCQVFMYGLARFFVDGHMAAEGIGAEQAEAITHGLLAILGHGFQPRPPE